MTLEEKIHIFEHSQLVSNYFQAEALTAVYVEVLSALRAQQEQKTPCDLCGYGGKHLDAPPCAPHMEQLGCPAHPKKQQD